MSCYDQFIIDYKDEAEKCLEVIDKSYEKIFKIKKLDPKNKT